MPNADNGGSSEQWAVGNLKDSAPANIFAMVSAGVIRLLSVLLGFLLRNTCVFFGLFGVMTGSG